MAGARSPGCIRNRNRNRVSFVGPLSSRVKSYSCERGGGNVGGTQLSPIQLDCLRAARRRDEDEPDWGAYWTRLAEHQEAAGQHLAASMARREAAYETVPWHQAAHAAASGWP